MKILLTGVTGYIGKRLLPVLIKQGHSIVACTRDKNRFEIPKSDRNQIEVWEVDFLDEPKLDSFPRDIDVAYFLIHSMSASIGNFQSKEERTAQHFKWYMDHSNVKQIIYLTGIINEQETLSDHLKSRLSVEKILSTCQAPLTALRAGIIVGSGSASFEIIRDLVEKLPIMIAPKWLDTRCEPIAVRDVIQYLTGVMLRKDCFDQYFDLSSGEILTYQEMLQGYAKVRKLKRWIKTIPVMTPRLSSYWLYFVTSTSYPLAVNLVNSMKVDMVGQKNDLAQRLNIKPTRYEQAVAQAFQRIEQNLVISSWKDSLVSSTDRSSLMEQVQVPQYGVFKDHRMLEVPQSRVIEVVNNIWSIGGQRGWYYANWLWRLRGYLDKLFGGVGLRRGRTHLDKIEPGDALDFWRVLVSDRNANRLLLYAEMKLPGEAWLEFSLASENGSSVLSQTATFRPNGILGRLYWYAVLPFHHFIFNGMIHEIIRFQTK